MFTSPRRRFDVGTLLLPAFLLFFDPAVAVALTAVVHLANDLFKLALLGRHGNWSVVLRFGLPGIATAVLGASLLAGLSGLEPLYSYRLLDRTLASAFCCAPGSTRSPIGRCATPWRPSCCWSRWPWQRAPYSARRATTRRRPQQAQRGANSSHW